jgi:hypothetical protein
LKLEHESKKRSLFALSAAGGQVANRSPPPAWGDGEVVAKPVNEQSITEA